MESPESIARLRHSLANPLAALLAETQLLMLEDRQLDEATLRTLKEIERLAIRMRGILRESQAED
jgi:signal transduction histidine kinase